jgi:hypothetical protein
VVSLLAFLTSWLVYLVLAAVKSRSSRVDGVAVIGAVVLSTSGFFVRGLIAGTSLDGMLYGSALLSALILVVTLGDPSLMFDLHLMKAKQFRRLPKVEQARVKAKDRRSGVAQLTFIVIVVVAVSLYVALDWTFLD